MSERHSAVKSRSQTMSQIRALLITAPEQVHNVFRAIAGAMLVSTTARTRPAESPRRVRRANCWCQPDRSRGSVRA
jgi:hypothetical protein